MDQRNLQAEAFIAGSAERADWRHPHLGGSLERVGGWCVKNGEVTLLGCSGSNTALQEVCEDLWQTKQIQNGLTITISFRSSRYQVNILHTYVTDFLLLNYTSKLYQLLLISGKTSKARVNRKIYKSKQ